MLRHACLRQWLLLRGGVALSLRWTNARLAFIGSKMMTSSDSQVKYTGRAQKYNFSVPTQYSNIREYYCSSNSSVSTYCRENTLFNHVLFVVCLILSRLKTGMSCALVLIQTSCWVQTVERFVLLPPCQDSFRFIHFFPRLWLNEFQKFVCLSLSLTWPCAIVAWCCNKKDKEQTQCFQSCAVKKRPFNWLCVNFYYGKKNQWSSSEEK